MTKHRTILALILSFARFLRCQNSPTTTQYQKFGTSFSGVTFESVPSYLTISGNDTVYLPLQTSDLNKNLNYTIMGWFKLSYQPKSSDPALLFAVKDSVACYVDSDFAFTCQISDYTALTTMPAQLQINKWFHLTLAISEKNDSYLQIETNEEVISTESAKNYRICQSSNDWQICIGQRCIYQVKSFVGGVRELKVRNIFVDQATASVEKNIILPFSNQLKGYYRFQGQIKQFLQDQYSANQANLNSNNSSTNLQAYEMLPIDVCPNTYNLQEFYRLDQTNPLQILDIKTVLKQTGYSYTVVLTTQIDQNTCSTNSIAHAIKGCNLVNFDEVFMIYFIKPNIARIHFFAEKSYYQTQSVSFFVPFNQILTFQLSINQYQGYKFYQMNQWGQVITTFQNTFDLQKQIPGQRLSLFTGLSGVVKSFNLFNEHLVLPIFSNLTKTPLVSIDLSSQKTISQTIPNLGTDKGEYLFAQKPTTIQLPYSNFLESSLSTFDGVTCQNNQLSLQLSGKTSQLSFQIPEFESKRNQSAIEFWFKFQDSASFNSTGQLFLLQEPKTRQIYWQVYFKNGTLTVAPFGALNQTMPTIPIPEFKLKNQDQSGWWHLSCSYSFNEQAVCTLANTKIEVQQITYLAFTNYFVPNSTLVTTFGRLNQSQQSVAKVLVKEFRYWNKRISLMQIQQSRYSQIDPNSNKDLKSYVRLIGGFENFLLDLVSLALDQQQNSSSSMFTSVAMVPDFTMSNQTVFDQNTQSIQVVQKKAFHTICPLQTYYHDEDQLCYSYPINEVVLAVYPFLNKNGSLSWLFSVEDTSVLNEIMLWQMGLQWQSNDKFVSFALNKAATVLNKLVSADYFRQEDNYEIEAAFTNSLGTVLGIGKVQFVPDKCHWFEVDDADAYSGFRVLNIVQGVQDISLFLVHKTNPLLDCSQFDYYSQFDSLDFKFFISNSDQYLTKQPLATYQVIKKGSSIVGINVTIPADEQLKLPSWTVIRMLMSVYWKSNQSIVSDGLSQGAIFQNLMYKLNFSPSDNVLKLKLKQNSNQITRGQQLVLDASETTVTNFPSQMLKYSLLYYWDCPKEIQSLCQSQSTSTLSLPWSSVTRQPIKYGQVYNITLRATWIQSQTSQKTESLSVQVTWFNVTQPNFTITYSPQPVLVSAKRSTTFQISNFNFNFSEIASYNVYWNITPMFNSTAPITFAQSGTQTTVQPGYWQPNTNYFVSLQLSAVVQPSISAIARINFTTGGPPIDGTVQLLPLRIQGEFMVAVSGWRSVANLPIFYNVFNTFDQEGLKWSSQLNSAPVPQKDMFQVSLTTRNPLQVQILDTSGEIIIVLLKQSAAAANSSGQEISNLTNSSSTQDGSNQTPNALNSLTPGKLNNLTDKTRNLQYTVTVKQSKQKEEDYQAISQKTTQNNSMIFADFDKLYQSGSSLDDAKLISILEDAVLKTQSIENDYQSENEVFKRLDLLSGGKNYKGKAIEIHQLVNLWQNHSIRTDDAQILLPTSLLSTQFDQYLQVVSVKPQSGFSKLMIKTFRKSGDSSIVFQRLNGAVQIKFDYTRTVFSQNQTLCVVRSLQDQWNSESCLTEYDSEQSLVLCTCNMMESDLVTVIDDYSRVQNGVIENQKAIRLKLQQQNRIHGRSSVFIATFSLLFAATILATIVVWQKQRNPLHAVQGRILSLQETQFCYKLAHELQVYQAQIEQNIDKYLSYTVEGKSRLLSLVLNQHPLLRPFHAEGNFRLFFLSGYLFQVHIYALICLMWFGTIYRHQDTTRQLGELDQIDIKQGVLMIFMAGICLLFPLVPDALFRSCTDEYIEQTWCRIRFRRAMIFYCQTFNVITLRVAVNFWQRLPATNQYLVVISFVGGLLFASLVTNFVFAAVCYYTYSPTERIDNLHSYHKYLRRIDLAKKVWDELQSSQSRLPHQNNIRDEPSDNLGGSFDLRRDTTDIELVVLEES